MKRAISSLSFYAVWFLLMVMWVLVLLGSLAEVARGQCGTQCGKGGCPTSTTLNVQGWGPAGSTQISIQQQQRQVAADRKPDLREVRIVVRLPGGGIGIGSGTIIQGDKRAAYVLTCAHILHGMKSIEVHLADNRGFLSEVVGRDDDLDLSVLRIADPGVGYVPIAVNPLQIGASVGAVGWAEGTRFATSVGAVTQMVSPANLQQSVWMETSCVTTEGQSGGGMYNAGGELVGTISCGDRLTSAGPSLPLVHEALKRMLPPYGRGTTTTVASGGCGTTPETKAPIVDSSPTMPAPQPVADTSVNETILARLEAIEKRIAEIKSPPGPPGPVGPEGPPGKDGRDGKDGAPGKTQPIPIDQIAAEVLKKLPPIHVQVIKDGKVIQSEDVPLGGVLPLRLVPVHVSSGGK